MSAENRENNDHSDHAERRRQVEALAREIRFHRDRYYNAEPEISDEEFDALEDRLRELAPEHPVLKEVGATPVEQKVPFEASKPASTTRLESLEVQIAQEDIGVGADLAERLRAANDDAYEGRPPSEKLYATLYAQMLSVDPAHPVLSFVVPPRGMEWPKARHEIPMGSLNKVTSEDELRVWAERCDLLARTANLEPPSSNLIMTEKLDGLSLEVVYDGGIFQDGITRGDGLVGEQISANVRRMKGVPPTISHPGRVSVRGEIVLKKSDAEAFISWRRSIDSAFTELKSLRNAAAGLARAKELRWLYACRFLTVLFYDLEGVEGLNSERDKIELLQSWKLATPTCSFGDVATTVATWHRYARGAHIPEPDSPRPDSQRPDSPRPDTAGLRRRLDYEIDGLVVRANDLHAAILLGELNNRPRAAVAFKFENEMQVTTLRDILWSTGDSGRITPIAQIEPVRLAGAEIRQASLHNWTKVRSMNVGVGDQVLVSRRGDVIPYVEKVMVHLGHPVDAPKTCRSCGQRVSVEGEYLVCRNPSCPARGMGRIMTWVKVLGLLDWGPEFVRKLWEHGLVREVRDLYRLSVERVAALPREGKVSAEKRLIPLFQKKEIELTTFIAALGIENVSYQTAKLLVKAGFDSIERIAQAPVEALSKVSGLGEIKAERIRLGVQSRLEEVERLAAEGVVVMSPKQGGPLAGLSFCFSGSFSTPRKKLQVLVEENGGLVASSVTKGVTYLVLSDANSTSSKAEKARKLGTQILDEAQFDALLVARGVER